MTMKSKKAKIHEGRPPKCHIRTGDTVVLISGPKERRGKSGTVIRVFPRRQRAVVDGPCAAVDVRHIRANPQANVEGGRVTRLRSIHISNLALLDPETGKPTRVRRERDENGKLVRVSKKSGHRFEGQ